MILVGIQATLIELNDKVGTDLEHYTELDEQETIEELRKNNNKFSNIEPSNKLIDEEDVCVSSGFNDLRNINGNTLRHNAIDIVGKNANKKYEVLAAHDGVVKIRELTSGYCRVGNSDYIFYSGYVLIEIFNDTYKTQYLHLDRINVKHNDVVNQGESLGIMGNQGCSTGTHLHYAVYKMRKDKFILENPEPDYSNYSSCNQVSGGV